MPLRRRLPRGAFFRVLAEAVANSPRRTSYVSDTVASSEES